MGKTFKDIYGDTYVALPAGYGIEGGFPIDLRTVLPGTTMLEALIHNGMAYEGMLVYIGVGSGTGVIHICKQKFHSATWYANGDIAASKDKYYTDEQLTQPVNDGTADGTTVYSNMLWHEEYQVSSTSSETATQADKLSHNVVINGKTTNFALPTGEDETVIDTGLFTPETIAAGTDIDTITHCGFYSCGDGANSYSLLIQQIGDKLYRTKISIDSNGVPVIETSIGVSNGETIVWDNWVRLAVGKSITTATQQNLKPITNPTNCVALHVKIGTTPELWVYSEENAQYPSGYANIRTDDGQVFTIGSQSAIIEHPFLVKLVNDNGTRTATVESLKANGSNFGMVKLSDSTNTNSGVNAGVAATPSAVKNVQTNLTNHESAKGNASNFGHVKLSDATNSDSAASANIAATPKAVKTVQANLTDHTDTKGNGSTYGHVKLSDATNSDSAASANIAATPKAVNTLLRLLSKASDYKIGVNDQAVASGQITIDWYTDAPSTSNDAMIILFTQPQPSFSSTPKYFYIGSNPYYIASGSGTPYGTAAGFIYVINPINSAAAAANSLKAKSFVVGYNAATLTLPTGASSYLTAINGSSTTSAILTVKNGKKILMLNVVKHSGEASVPQLSVGEDSVHNKMVYVTYAQTHADIYILIEP